jgi:hypothetical protein
MAVRASGPVRTGLVRLVFALAGLASFGCALVWAAATGNRPLLRKLWGFDRPVVIVGGGFAIVIAILLATR